MTCHNQLTYCRLSFLCVCVTESLNEVFSLFGFEVDIKDNLTASEIRREMKELSKRNFINDDALVSGVTCSQSWVF